MLTKLCRLKLGYPVIMPQRVCTGANTVLSEVKLVLA